MDSQCNHSSKAIKQSQCNNWYCSHCGIVISQGKTLDQLCLIKPISYNRTTEIDPLHYIKQMQQYTKDHFSSNPSEWYIANRKHAIQFLKHQCKSFNSSDKTFFSALKYIDAILSPICYIQPKEFDLIVISCFLFAGKFSENDSYSYDLNHFTSSNGKMLFSAKEVSNAELQTLKLLNYDLNDITLYDYLSSVLNCGIVFEKEYESEELLNKLYLFCFKLLMKVTYSDIALEYNIFQIVFSIVYLTRRRFNLPEENMSIINHIFGVHYWDYLECCDSIINLCSKSKEKSIKKMKNDLASENIQSRKETDITDTKERKSSMSTNWDSQRT